MDVLEEPLLQNIDYQWLANLWNSEQREKNKIK